MVRPGSSIPDQHVRDRVITNVARHQFLEAGAGSGKTDTLVRHYLEVLETEKVTPAEIVSVTFTNKAAREMKQRLREECRARARRDPLSRWVAISRELETAPIDTIHGLCSRILRENAVAAGLDPSFAVLEEPEAGLLLEDAVQRSLLERLDADEDSAARLVLAFGLRDAVHAICHMINDRTKMRDVFGEECIYLEVERLQAQWEAKSKELMAQKLKALLDSELWTSARDVIRDSRALDTTDKLEQKRQQAAEIIEQVNAAYSKGCDPEVIVETLAKLLEIGPPGQAGAAAKWPDTATRDKVSEALRLFTKKDEEGARAIARLKLLAAPSDIQAEAAQLTCALAQEARAALEAYQAAKRDRGALDFEDLLVAVRDLWDRAPQVLQRYQRRVRHVMIDEFQDTNALQKEILWRMADGGARRFVVGDVKQSIYRFRNADVTVFSSTRQEMCEAGEEVAELTASFRCAPGLIAFYNQVFGHAGVMGPPRAGRPPYEAWYEPLQAVREAGPGGGDVVEIHLVENRAASSQQTEQRQEGAAADADLEALRRREAVWIARRISQLIAEQRQVWDKQEQRWRGARFGDIALLFSAMSDVALYEQALHDAQVPYYVVAGRGYCSRQEVRDVLNCLAAVENPLDEVALVGALRSPLFALSDETLFWLAQTTGTWWQRLHAAAESPPAALGAKADEVEKVRFAAETLRQLRRIKNRLSLAELVNAVVEHTGLSAALAAQFGGMQMVSNLRKLGDIAGQLDSAGGYSLRGFIEYVRALEAREEHISQAPTEEESGDSVKLLTIHAAKGLEWPIVFLPDLAREAQGDRGKPRWHPSLGLVAHEQLDNGDGARPAIAEEIKERNEAEEQAERKRRFYVGATRARDLLIMSACVRRTSQGCWTKSVVKGPLGWLDEALGRALSECRAGALSGEGWSGILTVERQDEAEGEVAEEAPVVALSRQPERGEVAADEAQVKEMLRAVLPVAPSLAGRRRFTPTELAIYLHCPMRYKLQYLEGLPSEAPSFPSLATDESLSPTERGDVVHHMLRVLGTEGRERLGLALAEKTATVSRPADYGLDTRLVFRAEGCWEEIVQTVREFVASELYARWVAGARRLRTEMTVVFPLDGALIEGQIDALAEDAHGQLCVLDYKTGKRRRDTEQGYRFQVGLYCHGVEVGCGKAVSQAYIVYLDSPQIEAVALCPSADGQVAVERASEAIRAIRAGVFAPAHDSCFSCPVRWACESRRSAEHTEGTCLEAG